MKTARDIVDTLGAEAISARVGVKRQAVYNARTANKLPALWYVALNQMAGEQLPHEAFTFKAVDNAGAAE